MKTTGKGSPYDRKAGTSFLNMVQYIKSVGIIDQEAEI